MASKVIENFIKMALFKKGGAIASDKAVKFSSDALEKRLINLGIDPNSINNQTQLKQLLAYVKQAEDQQFNQLFSNVLSGDDAANFLNKAFPKKGEVIPFKQKRSFSEEIEAMKKSGDIVDKDNMVISEKITDREMFKDAGKRFKKKEEPIDPDFYDGPFDNEAERIAEIKMSNEGFIADSVARITSMEPVAAMKEANKIIKREGIYKNLNKDQSQAILKGTDDWINQRDLSDRYDYKKNRPFRDDPDFDPDDPDYLQRMKDEDADNFATGGRAGHYTGGMVDVEPSLSDIGHGSDSLMARTRLVSPGNQATTSTGLNYLLAEDNDNIRVPFSGGGMGRRAFLKLMAALTGGVAAAKSGILGLGEGAGKKVVTKTVEKAAGSGQPPPYFLKLVEKIRTLGDETLASQDKAIAKKYKDYVMEEDFAGNISIMKKNMDDPYPEEVIMSLKVDEVPVKGKSVKVDDYEEFTVKPDGDGKMKDIEPGVPDEVVQEGTMFEDNMTEFGVTKKAEGGRIGYAEKGIVDLADLESLKRLKEEGLNSEDGTLDQNPRQPGLAGLGASGRRAARSQSEDIKNKVIGAFAYAVDNLDQETKSYVKSLFNNKLQVGYETTMSGIKQDAFGKTGLVPIDDETIYKAIVSLDLPQDVKLKMSAITDKAGNEKIKASLKSNSLGLTWDNEKQEIIGKYTKALSPDGSLTITPIVGKDENSNIVKDIQIDKAFDNGTLKFSLNESDIFNKKNIGTKFDGENISFFAEKNTDDFKNTLKTGATVDLPVYLLNKDEKPTVSFNLNKNLETGFESKMFSGDFPITDNLSLFGLRKENDSGFGNTTNYGLEYNYEKPIGDRGSLYTRANIDNQGDYGINVGFSIPFGEPEKRAPLEFSTNKPEEAYKIYKKTDGFKTDPRDKERPPPMMFAEGGRIGFSGGGIFRAIIAKAAAAKGMKPYEFIKVTNYKGLPPEVKMFMSADDFAKLKSGQEQMYNNYIDMMKTRKNFQEQVEGGKKTPASPIFEHMENMMEKQSYVPKTVTADDIAEAELMVKNRFNKGRKDNAKGGLQTMLGE